MADNNRRQFMLATAGGLGLTGLYQSLAPLGAAEVNFDSGIAQFSGEVEPLVRFLEETPRDAIIEQTAQRVHSGVSYRELLAALMLAGVRNVQPRPSVGHKFHAVLVVNSAHLASLSSADEDRWLPIFWAIDNFKGAQARDVREGNWTLQRVDESNVPGPGQAAKRLEQALDTWDEEAADTAVAGMVRNFGSHRVFEFLAPYAARDYRSIGHKAIYLSNSFRTLETIGWEYAEPVLRSLVYAMLNHVGQPNPSQSDLPADRPGRFNWQQVDRIKDDWQAGQVDGEATVQLVRMLHTCSPREASDAVVDMLNRGVAVQSIWDGLFGGAGELLMRKGGIVPLHAVTTSNAIHHAFRVVRDDRVRRYLLLQNASFMPMFRETARGRGELNDMRIDELSGDEGVANTVPEIFETMGRDRNLAARQMLGFLSNGGSRDSVIDYARRLVFLKGSNSHDYKFSSAALEDYRVLSPPWQARFLAASTHLLRATNEPTRALAGRIQDALS